MKVVYLQYFSVTGLGPMWEKGEPRAADSGTLYPGSTAQKDVNPSCVSVSDNKV
jgi:hypothetical protein